jgi:hypothetical protein
MCAFASMVALAGGCSGHDGGHGNGTGGVGTDLAMSAEPGDDMATAAPDLATGVRDLATGARDLTVVPPPDMAKPLVPGKDTTVTLFDATPFYWEGGNDHRQSDASVTLPADGEYKKITLHIQLGCRTQCDPWDRRASIGIVDPATNNVVEIGRFMTTYGVPGAWDVDVTDLRPLLAGKRTAHGFIDTWVGGAQGWTVTASLQYVGGIPNDVPEAVVALPWGDFDYGNPDKPVASSLTAQKVTLMPGTTHAALRVTVTGHGQGNKDNCAEFCAKGHTVLLDGKQAGKQTVWKSDCNKNPINNQGGTWDLARAGWCPGEAVQPWTVALGAHTAPFTLAYAVDDYTNTCSDVRNDAICVPNDCAICNPGECGTTQACAYNNNGHTSPFFGLSAVLIEYR